MAIQKTLTLPNGTSGNYWKITSVTIDKISMSVSFTVSLFFDKAVSDAKNPSLGVQKHFSFSVTKTDLVGDLVAFGYAHIKALVAPTASMPPNPHGAPMHLPGPDLFLTDGTDV